MPTAAKIRIRKTPNGRHQYTATVKGLGIYGWGDTPDQARTSFAAQAKKNGVVVSAPKAALKWLRKNALTEFAQFSHGRIERTPFPMGGYVYIVRDNGKAHYMGNDLDRARREVVALSK